MSVHKPLESRTTVSSLFAPLFRSLCFGVLVGIPFPFLSSVPGQRVVAGCVGCVDGCAIS